ncbi:MAG: PrsW family intramembrane metalloprotease [Acidimicrobiia bacterium]|nr:PrsW family intramembrane metalloprotease [Acidimicrobiia bacterium]
MPAASLLETEPGWGQGDSLWQPRRPAFWLAAVLLVLGALLLYSRVSPGLNVDLGAASLTLVIWTLYAVPLVLLIVGLDLIEPEPPAFLASAFAWGALVATSVAMVANTATQSLMTKLAGPEFTHAWWPALSGPTTEETVKALGIVVVVLIARRQVTTVLDGLVYGLFVGLGFQVAENIVYTADRLPLAAFGGSPGRVVLDMFILRGLALGLWSHAVYTGFVGFGIAFALIRVDRSRWVRAAVLLGSCTAAWGLHFLWNTPFLQPERAGAPAWEDIVLYVGKGLPALCLVIVVYVFARRREVAWFACVLHDEADVTPAELEALTSLRGRRAACRAARRARGRNGARAMHRLQRAQVRLALTRARSPDRDSPAVQSARAAVREARRAVADEGLGEG